MRGMDPTIRDGARSIRDFSVFLFYGISRREAAIMLSNKKP